LEVVDLPKNQAVAALQEFALIRSLSNGVILSGASSPALQSSKRLDVWLNNSRFTQLVHGDERA